jgi:hypothetical protein
MTLDPSSSHSDQFEPLGDERVANEIEVFSSSAASQLRVPQSSTWPSSSGWLVKVPVLTFVEGT